MEMFAKLGFDRSLALNSIYIYVARFINMNNVKLYLVTILERWCSYVEELE